MRGKKGKKKLEWPILRLSKSRCAHSVELYGVFERTTYSVGYAKK